MARKINQEHDWDDPIIEPIRNIPDGIQDIAVAAFDLVKISIGDAKKFNPKHAARLCRNNSAFIEAVDWLFYSRDDQPWSFGWVMDVIGMIRGDDVNIAAARLALLKDPELMMAKQEYDLMIPQGSTRTGTYR